MIDGTTVQQPMSALLPIATAKADITRRPTHGPPEMKLFVSWTVELIRVAMDYDVFDGERCIGRVLSTYAAPSDHPGSGSSSPASASCRRCTTAVTVRRAKKRGGFQGTVDFGETRRRTPESGDMSALCDPNTYCVAYKAGKNRYPRFR